MFINKFNSDSIKELKSILTYGGLCLEAPQLLWLFAPIYSGRHIQPSGKT
jgi:hypothetical protein